MVEEALVEIAIADAVELIKKLDENGTPPCLAVWYYSEDAGNWQFVLASSYFDTFLPAQESAAYRSVITALARTSASSLSPADIKLISTTSPLARAIRHLVQTAPPDAIVRRHFTSTYVTGIFIQEMVVLRSVMLPTN